MKHIIEDTRTLMKEGLFKDEQHIRFSLVGRICQALGWNIWNPAEFYTEYKVEKLPTQILPKDSNGRVDIALFLPENNHKAAEVFMEIKAPGKLIPSLKDCENQLHAYTGYHRIAIGILTDGAIWRFYVPAIGGYFKDTLFAEINLMRDDVDVLVDFFNDVLRRDKFRKRAIDKAEQLFFELSKISMIQSVKPKAIELSKELGYSQEELTQRFIQQNHSTYLQIEEIKRLWNRTVPDRSTESETHSWQSPPRSETDKAKVEESSSSSFSGDTVQVFINAKGVKARGLYDPMSAHLTILKGSEIVKDHSVSFDGGYLQRKLEMIDSGQLYLDPTGRKYVLRQDTLFNKPSAASRLVLGRSSNGYTDWQDAENRSLEVHRRRKK